MIRHFLSLSKFSQLELLSLINRANSFSLHHQNSEKTQNLLKNKIFANIFYEPSTRTRCSFEIAAKRLGADVVNFVPENSSIKKGETLFDSIKSLESLGVDSLIIRHSDDHVFEELEKNIFIPIINAGAGIKEHPSQTLLDLLTLFQEFKYLQGLKLGICGDIKHSRVASSMIMAAETIGMEIYLAGPDNLIPKIHKPFVNYGSIDQILPEVDAMIMLRVQMERHEIFQEHFENYNSSFGLNKNRINKMKTNSIIMHPGPFQRGVEIADDIIEHEKSRIFKQMRNGVFARMAIFEWIFMGNEK